MAICPECRAVYGDEVRSCAVDGSSLLPEELCPAGDVDVAPGTMIGEYRVERKLGAGTFGDVYAGEHPLIGKRVAIKILNRKFASQPQMVSRFVSEARAVNMIRQRNIIDIFSFGVLRESSQHYFVMELLEGLTLGALLAREGRLLFSTMVPIVRGIAEALDAVHEAGITHRDLKPDNVFLAVQRDGSYFPKLLDFGIAKLAADEPAHHTGTGVVLGTPRYMSPEQARGKKAGPTADVYALGAMIHEMLTGSPPFLGDSAMDVVLKHATERPPSMSSVCRDLPSELDSRVLVMLAKRPKDRPQSAGQAVAALIDLGQALGLDRPGTRPSGPAFSPFAAPAERSDADAPRPITDVTTMKERPAGGDATRATALRGAAESASTGEPPLGSPPRRMTASAKTAEAHANRGGAGASAERTGSASASDVPSDVRSRAAHPRRWPIAAVVAAAAAIGGSAVWASQRMIRPAPAAEIKSVDAPADTSLSRAAPVVSADPPAVSPAAQASVVLRLSTQPADVEVWLGNTKIGTSSAPLSLPRGTARLDLRLRKQGFRDEPLSLTPDRDHAVTATLSSRLSPPLPPRRDAGPAGSQAPAAGGLDKILGDRE